MAGEKDEITDFGTREERQKLRFKEGHYKTRASRWLSGQESASNAGDVGLIPREENGNSSILAWEIPWTEEPGGLRYIGVTKESDMNYQLNNNDDNYETDCGKIGFEIPVGYYSGCLVNS